MDGTEEDRRQQLSLLSAVAALMVLYVLRSPGLDSQSGEYYCCGHQESWMSRPGQRFAEHHFAAHWVNGMRLLLVYELEPLTNTLAR